MSGAGLALLGLLLLFPGAPRADTPTSGSPGFHWAGAEEAALRRLQGREPATRLAALELLAEVKSERADALLRGSLRDPDRSLRLLAARLLVARGNPLVATTLREWLGGGNAADRAAALEALRLAGSMDAGLRSAVERTLRDPEVNVKLAALAVLERDPAPSAIRLALLLEDPRPAVRLTAIRLLGRAGDRRTTIALGDRLDDVDPEVQREAVRALGLLADVRSGPALLRLLHHGPEELREAVVDALARLRLPAAVPSLVAIARQRPADARARQAQWALGRIGTPEAVRALLAELDRGPLSAELEEALARHPRVTAPEVLQALQAEDPRAATAARLAGSLRLVEAIPGLVALLRARGEAALPALRALQAAPTRTPSSDTPDVIPALVDAATDGPPALRRAAMDTLLQRGHLRAEAVLDSASSDDDPHVRLRAVQILARVSAGNERDRWAALLRALQDPVPAVATAAVEAMAGLASTGRRPTGGTTALLIALRRLPGREPAVGWALRSVAAGRDLPALRATLRGLGGDARLAVLDGIVGAVDRAVALASLAGERASAPSELQAALAAGGPGAELAAEALAQPGVITDDARVRQSFEKGPVAARAALAASMARSRQGAERLAAVLRAPDQPAEVRAAAAAALAGSSSPQLRALLGWAANHDAHPAVAANARAALGAAAPAAAGVALRLIAPAGTSPEGRWLRARRPGDAWWWARTGSLGQARLPLPPGALEIEIAGSDLPQVLLQHPGHRIGQLAREDMPAAEPRAGLRARQPMGVHAQDGGVAGR